MIQKCTKCNHEVKKEANDCRNCGADLKKQRKTATIGGLSIFSIIIAALFWSMSGSDEDGIEEFDKSDALIMSHDFVRRNLKSPSTAEFGYGSDKMVQQVNDSTFIINSYVDSQNSFGAMLRSDYTCTLYFDQKRTAHLIDLKIN